MSDDAVRWDEKYLKNKHPDTPQPDPLLVEYIDLFQPGQLVVDLASGKWATFIAPRCPRLFRGSSGLQPGRVASLPRQRTSKQSQCVSGRR